ncbi:MAG: hypothetical protein V1787_03555 [Candidatus Micrarchaeota archaeon]
MVKARQFLKAYSAVHQTRASWYHLQWRVFAALLAAAAVALIHSHLVNNYATIVPGHLTLLGEQYFYWFMAGGLFGIVAVAAVFEGEFLLGVRRVAHEVEDEARQEFRQDRRRAGRKR